MTLASSSLKENLTKTGSRSPQQPLIQPPAARDAARLSGSSYDEGSGPIRLRRIYVTARFPCRSRLAQPSSSSDSQIPLHLASKPWRKNQAYRGGFLADGTLLGFKEQGTRAGDTIVQNYHPRCPTPSGGDSNLAHSPDPPLVLRIPPAQRLIPCTSHALSDKRRSPSHQPARRPQPVSSFNPPLSPPSPQYRTDPSPP